MIERRIRFRIARNLGYGAVAAGLVFLACERRVPQSPAEGAEAAATDSPPVIVRGEGSAPGPLYVVDGVIVDDLSIVDIQALEIERMDVLKGPVAEAQYGERGKNGVVAITTTGYAATTGTMRGTVLDPTGKPVANARVVIVGTSTVTLTGADGAYALAVPAGTYSVRAEFGNYQPTQMAGVRILAGETLTADFRLAEAPARQ